MDDKNASLTIRIHCSHGSSKVSRASDRSILNLYYNNEANLRQEKKTDKKVGHTIKRALSNSGNGDKRTANLLDSQWEGILVNQISTEGQPSYYYSLLVLIVRTKGVTHV